MKKDLWIWAILLVLISLPFLYLVFLRVHYATPACYQPGAALHYLCDPWRNW